MLIKSLARSLHQPRPRAVLRQMLVVPPKNAADMKAVREMCIQVMLCSPWNKCTSKGVWIEEGWQVKSS